MEPAVFHGNPQRSVHPVSGTQRLANEPVEGTRAGELEVSVLRGEGGESGVCPGG